MATRKKKSEEQAWPKVTVGSHLTVTTYENGRTELTWDDKALARDVREALAGVESAVLTKTKRTRKSKTDV